MINSCEIPIPAFAAGVGLKPDHYTQAIDGKHGLAFFEVHAENFMGAGGPPHRWLTAFREQIPISVHGVCLSLGGRDDLNKDHLARLKTLVDRYDPQLVSEHLAWSSDRGVFFNDLLPPPMTRATLDRLCEHVDQVQIALGRELLVENPSSYLQPCRTDIFGECEWPEAEFLNEMVRRTGCSLLLDINNIYVSAKNLGFEPQKYLETINASRVSEIHLAGHALDHCDGIEIRVDNHGSPVCAEVMELYRSFIRDNGPRRTLIEWDTDVPTFDVLVGEARQAKDAMVQASAQKELIHG
jgi:uncharacterized protein